MEKQKKLLVIANNCFSENSNNGRTLMYLLKKFDKESIAQFFISGNPDFNFCKNYYNVSDKNAFKAFLSLKKGVKNGKVKEPSKTVSSFKSGENKLTKHKKCVHRYIRNVIWKTHRWWGEEFNDFIESFSPDAVLVFAGDAPFICDIAYEIADKYSLPLFFYTTEHFVLKDVLYRRASKYDIFHNLLKKSLHKSYKRLVNKASTFIFNTDYLKECYENKYPEIKESYVFYGTTDMTECYESSESENVYLYCGNLGVGRIEKLIEFADVLKKVDDSAILRIFGKILEKSDEEELSKRSNIEYAGVIPYSEVPKNISKSRCVIHCENGKFLENLKGAFSTKIADCLACGKPFLVYASKEFPFVRYLMKYNASHIASDKQELCEILLKFNENEEFRNQYIDNAKKLTKQNHNSENNAEKIYNIINNV